MVVHAEQEVFTWSSESSLRGQRRRTRTDRWIRVSVNSTFFFFFECLFSLWRQNSLWLTIRTTPLLCHDSLFFVYLCLYAGCSDENWCFENWNVYFQGVSKNSDFLYVCFVCVPMLHFTVLPQESGIIGYIRSNRSAMLEGRREIKLNLSKNIKDLLLYQNYELSVKFHKQ